jgi:hypothetical protein
LTLAKTTDEEHAMSKVDLKSYAGSTLKSPYDVLARYNLEYQRLLVEVEGIFSAHAETCSLPGVKSVLLAFCGIFSEKPGPYRCRLNTEERSSKS